MPTSLGRLRTGSSCKLTSQGRLRTGSGLKLLCNNYNSKRKVGRQIKLPEVDRQVMYGVVRTEWKRGDRKSTSEGDTRKSARTLTGKQDGTDKAATSYSHKAA